MASKWPAVGTSVRRTPLQGQEQLEEENVLRPAAGHPETSGGALGSLCRHFQRRLPLRAVSLNLRAGPSWKRLESPGPGQQGLQAAARSAKSALGAVSQTFWWRGAGQVRETLELGLAAVGSGEPQMASEPLGVLSAGLERTAPAYSVNRWRIQESCHSGTKWLVETQVTAKRRRRGAQKGPRLFGAAPAYAALDPWERDGPRLSARGGPRTYPLRRSRREAALRSPYSSTEPLCSPSESDSDLEPVGAGLQHFQQLSQELDEAIVVEESGDMTDMTVSLIRD